jgi:hypothetical protein
MVNAFDNSHKFLLNTTSQTMPNDLDPFQELVWQLNRLPGGSAAAMPDFFGTLVTETKPTVTQPTVTQPTVTQPTDTQPTDTQPTETPLAEVWYFKQGGALELHADGGLRYADTLIAQLPDALLAAAAAAKLPAILLALLALATGDIDGDRRLKAALPQVDAAAKDLMLMTVCRLCG